MRRGEVYLVRFDPSEGAEIRKTRPALIVQNDFSNARSPVTIVAAITSSIDGKQYPTKIPVDPPEGGLGVPSVIVLNQLRSIDKRRLGKRLGALSAATMERVDRALIISLGLPRPRG